MCDRRPDHKEDISTTMHNISSDPLTAQFKVFQDGCPIEDNVEKFLNVSYRAPWKESTLKTIFLGGLDEHIYQQMPASDITCSLERYIECALWLIGPSFTVGEVGYCPVAKTVSPTSPAASHIPTSTSTFPRARKVIFNSADLVAKLADPSIISLRKSMMLNSTLRHSRSTLNQCNESILIPKSAPVSSSAVSPC